MRFQSDITGGLTAGTYRRPVLDAASPPVDFVPNRRQLLSKRGTRTLVKRKLFSRMVFANPTSDSSLYDGGWWRVRTR